MWFMDALGGAEKVRSVLFFSAVLMHQMVMMAIRLVLLVENFPVVTAKVKSNQVPEGANHGYY